MNNIYFYLYYKIYSLIKFIGINDIPAFSAMILVTCLVFLNLQTILNALTLSHPEILKMDSKNLARLRVIAVMGINAFVFFQGKRYRKIIEWHSKHDISPDNGSFWVICYVILTVYLFFHFTNEIRLHTLTKDPLFLNN
jgi:hypothetical protein